MSIPASEMMRLVPRIPQEEREPNALFAAVQTIAGLLVPLTLLRPFRILIARHGSLGLFPFVIFGLLSAGWLFVLLSVATTFATKGFPPFENPPRLDPLTFSAVGGALFRAMIGILEIQAFFSLPFDWLFFRSFQNVPDKLQAFERALKLRLRLERSIYSLIGTLFVIGFSLLPLAALLVALPAVAPDEAVLTDSVRPARTFWPRFRRRVFSVFAGLIVLAALLGFSIEVVSRVPMPGGGQLSALAKKVLGFTIVDLVLPEPFLEKAPKDVPEGEQWLTARELIEKRDLYREFTHRQNRNPEEQRDANAKLAEIDRLIDERLPTSPRLK
ncbi:MAG TPA: hypothetical protein VGL71_02460, partial [Urbifossiella sp.]